MWLILGQVAHSMGMCLMTSKVLGKNIALAIFIVAQCAVAQFSFAENCQSAQASKGADAVDMQCGGAPSAYVTEDGTVWVAFVQNQHVYVASSKDIGKTFSEPVQVNAVAENTEYNGENRPKIVVSESGKILLSWTTKTSSNFTGLIRFSTSSDDGKTFTPPRTMNDDGLDTGHRFDSLFLTESGKLYLTWIDKRDMVASLERGQDYAGAGIYYAVSKDLGETFSKNTRVSHNSCECCRIAMAPYGDDEVAILWRQIFDDHIRDHSIAVLGAAGHVANLERATVDDWYIDACPHHGPTMIQAKQDQQYHIAWFSNGNIHSGIHYGRYDMASATTSQIIKVDGTPGSGHPHLASVNGRLYMVWKGFDGEQTLLKLMESVDDGATWTAPKTLHTTSSASDYPLLVTDDNAVYLSWASEEYGYIFEELSHAH